MFFLLCKAKKRQQGEDPACVFVIHRVSLSSCTLHEKHWGGGRPLSPESHMIQLREWRGEGGGDKHRDEYIERKQRRCSLKQRSRERLLPWWSDPRQHDTLRDEEDLYSRLIIFNHQWYVRKLASAPNVTWKTWSYDTKRTDENLGHPSLA